ncbi:L-serine dehydratase [Penicillium atrosanguineum]|uniref:L-serine ammonia-lyase n=1 Tax=Penicillium atrosanguineum TaxID=1132637 RepID=A0A9W9GKK7_9EURO|nr:uncharacterized protein N7443_006682 [Penicillium atrosanguineum]KAJ5123335.1 L-serine dehydratase [Penicillium atrosanguineum]KAJ5298562.1 hypothetical protein N7443_006682 [Penicillium atrosanguineum]KAJ5321173.1 L-serine dehydratase [Penicillium atrosanguineum]
MASESESSIKKPWIETPLIECATLSKQAGCRIFLKLELLQPSGSFKSRGIGNLILQSLTQQSTKDRKPHFFSSSGGNAGLAAVHAARDLGCPCTVVVPYSTKQYMIDKLRAAGATEVVQHGASWFEADTFLRETFIEGHEGNVYVPPFDHVDIWEGAGGMISEIETQLGTGEGGFPADVIICSVGGGGLLNGVVEGLEKCLAKGEKGRDVRVVAVETDGAHALAHSLREGRLSSLKGITSQATSLGALTVAEKAFENAVSPPKGVVVESIVGSDADAARGVLRLADEMRLQVELACGISLEVALNGRLKDVVPDLNAQTKVVVVVCGGSNINTEMITEYRERLEQGWN